MQSTILYSDQVIPENEKVDAQLVDMMAQRGNRLGYIPSGSDPDQRFFLEKRAYYAGMGLALDLCYDLDGPSDSGALAALLACDMIHLSGGDTQVFLKRLRRSDLWRPLRQWSARGGLLVGTSAGAILITPTIALDALFRAKRPEDNPDTAALNLLPFEFFPHIHDEVRFLPELLSYSRNNSRMIAACPNGDGVIVSGNDITSIGDVIWISNGALIDPPAKLP